METLVENKLGIDAIKDVFKELIDAGEAYAKVMKDGKFNWLTETHIVGSALFGLKVIHSKGKQALRQFQDLDAQESNEIKEFIAREFDIEQDNVEVKIEQALDLLQDLHEIYLDIKNNFIAWREWAISLKVA